MSLTRCLLGFAVIMAAGLGLGGAEPTPGQTAEVLPSSIRWKEHVQPITSALRKTLQLRGVFFDWKPEYGGQHDIGFIAEEVGKIVPELVEWEVEGESAAGVKYERVTALTVEAIRELNACIERLQDYVLKIQSQIESQLTMIQDHESRISTNESGIASLQTQVGNLQTTTILMKADIEKLKAENQQLKAEIAALKAMIQSMCAPAAPAGR